MVGDSLFIKTLASGAKAKDIPRPPVWFMRQAGRALASYRKLKEQYSFVELLRDPQLASQVTLLPRDSLGIDALILFSDILVIPEALGVRVDYEGGGPRMLKPLKTTEGKIVGSPDPSVLEYVYRSIEEIKKSEKELPLIGFCGGPLTVFLYLYQGSGHGGDFSEALDFFYNRCEEVEHILEAITEMSIAYAQGQIASGVDAFQIFETWANAIPAQTYVERILPYVIRISEAVKPSVPLIFFPRFFSNGYELLLPFLEHFSGLGIDYLMELESLARRFPKDFPLQGNLDPTWVRYAQPQPLKVYLDSYLSFFQQHRHWIVNLGHGVIPGTPESNLKLIVDTVKASGF